MDKNRKKFSQGRVIVLYQFSEVNKTCQYSTQVFFFTIPRCERFFPGESIAVVGTLANNFDDHFYNRKRLIVQHITIINQGVASSMYWKRPFFILRAYMWNKITYSLLHTLSQPPAGILLSMVFGKKEYLLPSIESLFLDTGSSHLQVVSGYNFSVISAGLYQATKKIAGKTTQIWITLILGTGLLFLIGIQPSILRAYLSLITASSARFLLQRQYKSTYCLIITTLFLLLLFPFWIFSISFQLTFLATFGIVFITPILSRENDLVHEIEADLSKRNHPKFLKIATFFKLIKESCLVGLSVQLTTWPVLVVNFHQYSLIGLVVSTGLFFCISFISQWGFWLSLVVTFLYNQVTSVALQSLMKVSLEPVLFFFIRGLEVCSQFRWLTFDSLTITRSEVFFWYLLVIFVVYCRWSLRSQNLISKEITKL